MIHGHARLFVALALVGLGLGLTSARAEDVPLGFDGPCSGSLPRDWQHVEFPAVSRVTSYGVATIGSERVLRAVASRSASFVIRPLPCALDLDRAPRLRWRWRVERTILQGDGRSKATDDFPARVWVGFATDWSKEGWLARREAEKARERCGFDPPGYWIEYVWTGRGRRRSETFDEPYDSERWKCVALRTAADELGAWCTEEVDPRADWRRIFHSAPPQITAIAVMTDSDDTGSDAEALFADMAFVRPQEIGK